MRALQPRILLQLNRYFFGAWGLGTLGFNVRACGFFRGCVVKWESQGDRKKTVWNVLAERLVASKERK